MDKKIDFLSYDIFNKPLKVTQKTKENSRNSQVRGNSRIAKGMYYTDNEKELYKEESLERELP